MGLNLQLTEAEMENPNGDQTEIISKALLVPEILEIIFKNLETERLKRCRGVCLVWSNVISRLFHTRVIAVVSHGGWSKFQGQIEHGKGLRLLCPFQEMDATVEFGVSESLFFQDLKAPLPIVRLNLQGSVLYSNHPELSQHALQILHGCSETLTHLTTPFWTLADETSLEPSFQLPELKTLVAEGYEQSLKLQERESQFSEPELRFFLRIIASAPKLSTLTLSSLSAAPELLRLACLKKIENLVVCGHLNRASTHDTWEALNQIDTEALKYFEQSTVACFEAGHVGNEPFFIRFSSSLEFLRLRLELFNLPLCPRVRTLHFRMEMPRDLRCFPSLKQVVISGDTTINWLNGRVKPCPTVLDVGIGGVVIDEYSNRKTLLRQLLRLFPCATFWRVNYSDLEDFCEAAADTHCQFPIERLEINLNCSVPQPSRSSIKQAAQTDLRTFSNLRFLTNLRELDLHQDLHCPSQHYQGKRWPAGKRLLPYNIGGIKFKNLAQLRILRIYADSYELPPDFNTIQDSNLFVEVVVPSLRGPPNWSDFSMSMSNVKIICEKKDASCKELL